MTKLNVTHGDSRDEKERKRFFPFTPQDHLLPSKVQTVKQARVKLSFWSFQDLGRKTGLMKLTPNGQRWWFCLYITCPVSIYNLCTAKWDCLLQRYCHFFSLHQPLNVVCDVLLSLPSTVIIIIHLYIKYNILRPRPVQPYISKDDDLTKVSVERNFGNYMWTHS